MSKQVPWNVVILEEFIKLACLSEEEERLIRLRVSGYSIVEQAFTLGVSRSTINLMTKRLKKKYDLVQPYSAILPKRKNNIKELFG